MRKLLSIFVAVLMAISTLPQVVSAAAADDDIASAKAMLTAEMLTSDNEPKGAVTKPLDLNLTDDVTLPEGVSVNFSSSNENVINSTTGAVTRPLNKDEEVTITAAISKNGGTTVTKDFKFTVLAKTKEVLASDNLYYPDKDEKAIVDYTSGSAVYALPEWTILNATKDRVEKELISKITKDSSNHYGISSKRIAESGTQVYLEYKNSSLPDVLQRADDKSATLSMNIKPIDYLTGASQFYILLNRSSSTGTGDFIDIQFKNNQIQIYARPSATKLWDSRLQLTQNTNWKIDIKLDYNNNLLYLYLNDTLITTGGVALPEGNYTKQLDNVMLGCFRQMIGTELVVDDVAIIRETKWQVPSVSALTEEIVAGGQDPDFITEDLDLPSNSDITWTSSDPDVISNKGIVERPRSEDAEVTLTARSASGSKVLTFNVKAVTINAAVNDTFIAPYHNSSLLNKAYPQFTPATNSVTMLYQNSGSDYYINYNSKASYDSSKATFVTSTGSDFPLGTLGKYTIEFDIKYENKEHVLFALTGDGDTLLRINNCNGNVYLSNPKYSTNVWYGEGSSGLNITTAAADTWIPVKLIISPSKPIDANTGTTPGYELWFNNALVHSGELITDTTFASNIGMYMMSRIEGASASCGAKIDNFKIYTENTLSDLSNIDKANYYSKLITAETVTKDKSYSIENNLILNAPFAGLDLNELGVSVAWTSSNPSVISNAGVVTRPECSTYVTMTAAVTAGSGEDSVTVTKELKFTVAAADSSVYKTFNYDFEGTLPSNWNVNSNSTPTIAEHNGKEGHVLKADFPTANTGSTFANLGTNGALNKRYFISTDVCFEPESTDTKMYLTLNGAGGITRVGFDFKNGAVSLMGNDTEYFYMIPNLEITKGEWYHIDIDHNAAKKTVMAYINGIAITEEPLDIGSGAWVAWYPIRQIGMYSYGKGTGYVDNVIIRESNSNAPVYDENSDYTVRSIALTNQDGKTITNVGTGTTKVVAKVKMLQNRDAQDGTVKIILARYDAENKLAGIVSQEAAMSNKGLITSLEMPVDSNCVNHSFKIFVVNAGKLAPLTDNYASTAPKFDTEKLFNMDTNVEDAHALGYIDEPDINLEGTNIQAIIYDGDTYYGRKVRHFAYIGLPEGASAENPVPAVVCVHGGGGTAYAEWVKKWNEKGYAAIAMNLNGRIPQNKSIPNGNSQLRHAWPGATQDNYGTVSPDDATWMYSAVTAVIGAHNALREMPEIDNTKIGITGVSWGGVVTSTVIGVDNRFAFAIPSYGCGYLYGSETYMADAMTDDEKLWDPSSFIGNSDLPILWMNGDKDGNFSLTSTTKSIALAEENSYPCIIPNFGHNHSTTWNRPEPYAFADYVLGRNGAKEFIRAESAEQNGSSVTVNTNRNAVSAVLYYTTSETLTYVDKGTTATFSYTAVNASEANANAFTFTLPTDAKKYYITFKDEKNNNSSTVLYDVE